MAEQSLDSNEQLNVRWAFDDPNPRVIRQIIENKEAMVAQAIEMKGYKEQTTDYQVPLHYSLPNPVAPPPGVGQGLGTSETQVVHYPDTDQQYNDAYASYYYQQQQQLQQQQQQQYGTSSSSQVMH